MIKRVGFKDQADSLYRLINAINDVKIRTLIEVALHEAHQDFFIIPASSSGKYHPNEDNGKGGLVRHTIKCVTVVQNLFDFFGIKIKNERDIVIAACILHDICKNGLPESWGKHTVLNHGLVAYSWLDQFELRSKYTKELIRLCVRYHMSIWSDPKEEAIAAVNNSSPLIKIVQVADMISSRREISFFPGIEMVVNNDGDLSNG